MKPGYANDVSLVLALLLAIALIACGEGGRGAEDTPGQTTGPANDPCELVTGAEAEQVLGAPVESERPSEANNDYLATCRYVAPRGQSVVVLVVGVSRQSGRVGFDNARRMEEAGIDIEPVGDVGTDAFWVGDPLNTLWVLSDTTYMSIGGDVQRERARSLALQAVDRLR